MYLRNVLKGKNPLSFTKNFNKKFSVLDAFTRDSLSFRMTKYDPTKELEVNYILNFRPTSLLYIQNPLITKIARLPD